MAWNEDEETSILRLQKRAQRSVNKQLRRALKNAQETMDKMFLDLCDSSTEAHEALQKLWEEGNLQETCSSEDYQTIIDAAIKALKFYADNAVAFKPTQGFEGNGYINPGNGFIYQGSTDEGGLPSQ
jgi:hypothetical protein